MNKVFVLYCEEWGGSKYNTSLITVFADEEVAHRAALHMQQYHTPADTKFVVEEVEFEGLAQ